MIVALYIFLALVVVGGILYILHRREPDATPASGPQEPSPAATQEECCGMHITCERDSLLTAMASGIEYYDDEELDPFRGRTPDDYTAAACAARRTQRH